MYAYQNDLIIEIDDTKYLALLVIIGCLTIFFLIIAIVVLVFSRGITKPIGSLTKFTQDLKKAENKEAKAAVIGEVKIDRNFTHINEEYEEYQRLMRKKLNSASRDTRKLKSRSQDLATVIHTINEEGDDADNYSSPLISARRELEAASSNKVADSDSSSEDDKLDNVKWFKRDNEIDELKKIFFEFLMKWQEQQSDTLPYEPKFYKRDPDNDEILTLDELLGQQASDD